MLLKHTGNIDPASYIRFRGKESLVCFCSLALGSETRAVAWGWIRPSALCCIPVWILGFQPSPDSVMLSYLQWVQISFETFPGQEVGWYCHFNTSGPAPGFMTVWQRLKLKAADFLREWRALNSEPDTMPMTDRIFTYVSESISYSLPSLPQLTLFTLFIMCTILTNCVFMALTESSKASPSPSWNKYVE